MHVAAALDPIGGLLGVREFPATAAGYALLHWLAALGTSPWSASRAPGATARAWPGTWRRRACEWSRLTGRTGRTGTGRASPILWTRLKRGTCRAVRPAARAPKGRDGAVEAIRALMVAKRSARSERTQAINQARALIVTGPDDLRARFAGHTPAALIAELAALRPRPGGVPGYATRVALRELGRRAQFLDAQLERLDELIIPLVTARVPGLLSLHGVGPDTAALLLIAAGKHHPARAATREAAWAHLCGVAPIPASSGKVSRHRLNRGGNREANHALWRIVITRMSSHPATRIYVARRAKEGLSKTEIIRCLKRYVAREVYRHLRDGG